MNQDLVIGIPGPWTDSSDFTRKLVTGVEPMGRYLFAGRILADSKAKDHVPLDFCPVDASMAGAFEIAGQGKIPAEVLGEIQRHSSVVYLHFSIDLIDQRERILKFTQVIQQAGGIAVKLESAGVAHAWDRWFELMSGSPWDVYCASVVLIGDESNYYSCGMHHYGLPECEVGRSVPIGEAARLMNMFNFYQISEQPQFSSGHTFSADESSPIFRLTRSAESRYDEDDLFHNPHGIWRLDPT
ncbi:MAG: hypothetical protein WBC44_09200 [Planctomycetaceae bacterium]